MGTLIKLFMWLLLSLAAIPSELPAAAAEKAHRNVTAPNTAPVVIALRNDVPPFSFLGVDGHPAGLFVEMWKLWAARTGQTADFLMGTMKDNLQALESGSADLIGAMLDAADRASWITLSEPLYEIRVQLHFLKREGVLRSDRLKGERIGVVDRTAFQKELQNDYPDFEIVPFGTLEEMIHAARAGSLRAFLGMPTLVSMILNRLGLAGEFVTSDEILYTRTLHAGVRKDHVELLRLVDKGFGAISNEELAELESVWLPDPTARYFSVRSHRMNLTKEEEAWIRRHPRVNLATSEGFAPFSFVGQDNEPVGIWADYLELLRTRTGLDLRVTMAAPWETLMGHLQAKTVDGVACAGKTSEREELLAFTDPYLVVPWVIVARDDFQLYSVTLDDLSGKKVAVLKTSPAHEILQDYPKVNIVEVRKVEDIWETVSLGKADAGISNLASASYYISRKGITNLKVVGVLKDQLRLGLGIRKDRPELVGILNKAVGAITPDEHNAIQKKWMSVRYEQGLQWPIVRRWIVLIVAASGIILFAVMLLWNRRLTGEIAKRKRSEQALRESESRYRALFDLAPDPMAVTDLEDGRLIDVNQAFVSWSGYSYQELRGKTSVELGFWMSPRDRAAMVEQLAAAQSVYGLDVRMSNKTGEMRDVVFSSRLTEREGRKELFSIVHDITERKQAQDLLHKYAFMVGATPDLMSFIGRDYCYQAVNEAYLRAHQKTRVQIIGHSIAELHGTEVFNPIIKPEMDRCLAGEQIRYAAWFDYTGLGRRFVDVTYAPYTNNERAIMGVCVSVHDITERKLAEEALRESEARYREFFVTSRDAVFITTPEGQWIDFNDAAVDLFGFADRGDLARESVVQRYESSEERGTLLKTIEETGFAKEFPARLRQKDGTVMETLITAVPVWTPEGMLKSFVGTIRDVSRQKRAERALRDSEERNAAIIAAMPDLLFVLSEEGNYLNFHAPGESLLAIPGDRIIGSNISEIGLLPEVERTVRETIRRAIATRDVQRVAYQVNTPVGVRDFEARIARLDDHRVLSIVRDTTQQRLTEEAIRQSDERFRQFFAHLSDYAYMISPDGVILDINEAACRALGYERQELIGSPIIRIYSPESQEKAKQLFVKWRQSGQLKNEELEIIGKNGQIRQVLLNAGIVRGSRGEILHSTSVQHDITELVKAEKERREFEERLRRGEKMEALGMLAGGVAHDLNNVLGIVVGYAEMLADEASESDSLASYAKEIVQAGEKAATIVQDLLTLTRRGVPSRKVLNLNEIIIDHPAISRVCEINVLPSRGKGHHRS